MNSELSEHQAARGQAPRDRQFLFPRPVAWVVLVIAITASAGGWYIAGKHAALESRKRFDEEVGLVTAALNERMQVYQDVLHGAVGLFAASYSVERSEWRAYVNSVSIERRFPGIDGVGFVAFVPQHRVDDFLRITREDKTPDFEIKGAEATNDLFVIKYIEPEEPNHAMLGWNIAEDPKRRAVAELARDTARPALSSAVVVREGLRNPQPGFLITMPVYRRGLSVSNVTERRIAIDGWVFARFVTENLMNGVLADRGLDLHFRVMDTTASDTGELLFDSDAKLSAQRPPTEAWFFTQDPLRCGGRTWTLCYATKPSFEKASRRGSSLGVGVAGGLISLLLFGIAWSLSYTKDRALALAAGMTGTLRETNARLQSEIREREHSQRRAATQHAVTRALAESSTLAEATAKIMRSVCESLGWQVGALWQVNPQLNQLRCVQFWHVPGINVAEFETATHRRAFTKGEGLPGRVWADSKPAWIADISQDKNFPRAPFAAAAGLRGGFAFPILMGAELLGVIEFFGRDATEPDAELLSMMAATGSQIGQFIERKRSEAALKHSEGIYHSLVESLPLSITRKDLEGRIVFANQRFCTRFGVALADVTGKSEAALFPPEMAARREQADKNVIETGSTIETLEERVMADGSMRYIQAIRTPVYDAGRNIAGLLGIFWDVTDKRRAEADLEHERFLLRTLMDNLPDRIYFKDAQSRFLRNSRAHLQRFGLTDPADALGKSDFDFFSGEHAQQAFDDEQRLMRSGGSVTKEERETWPDGSVTWALSTKLPLRDEKGNTIGTFGISHDITDRKRAEETMLRAKEAAEEASRAKSHFLASMSHELRTPLNSVIGFANILLKNKAGALHAAELNFLDRILANGKHLLGLINQILDLSKIEAHKVEVQKSPVALDVLIRETVAQHESLVREKPVQLLVDVPEKIALLQTDAEKLKQVIINLIGNALKFTTQGSVTIRVVTDAAADHRPVRIDVVDTGIGIPKAKLGVIFEAFQQAEHGTARKYGGTGLGLTISQALCQLMGYRIVVRSREGEGSTFSVLFAPPPEPEVVAQQRVITPTLKPHPTSMMPPELKGRTVLVIDDELDSRTLLTHMIEEFGCHGITASSGEQGLHMAREFRPHLITVDLMMPNMDGWQVIRALKADPELRDIPVVVVSIVAGENRGRILGAMDMLQKPVAREELHACLRRCLPFTNPRILLVDDQEDSRKLLAMQLRDEACEFRVASNGREALEVMEEFTPDLVLLDLMMPVMDGMTFLNHVRSNPAHQFLPVVIVTAKDLSPDESVALGRLAQDVIQKGHVFEADLKSILRRLLQARARADTAGENI